MAGYVERTPPTRNFPKGGWKATYRAPDGKERSKTFSRKTDADTWLATTLTDRARGNYVDPQAGRITLAAYWIDWSAAAVLRPSTVDLYAYLYSHHIEPTFGSTELGRITVADVRKWRAGLLKARKPAPSTDGKESTDTVPKWSPNTVAKAYRLLARVMGSAVEDGRIAKNPCRITKAGVEHVPEMHAATVGQLHALADAVGDRHRAFVLLAGYSGLRWGELCSLRRGRVNVLHRTVQVAETLNEVNGHLSFGPPKTEASRRTVTVPASVMAEVERHMQQFSEPGADGLVFPASEGGPMRRSNFRRRVWLPAIKSVGVPALRVHDLRHTAGTLAAAVPGTQTKDHMARLGHASPRAALLYQHASDEAQQAIAAALDALAASTRPVAPTPLHRTGTDSL